MAPSRPRQQRARQTRQRICEAAKTLFLSRGYTATTITEIARAAGVAHQTVYFTYGSKAAVLAAILDAEIVGDVESVPLLDRPQVTAISRTGNPMRRLGQIVDVACDVTERLAPLYEIVRSGAADAEVRDLLDRHEEQRWRTLRELADLLQPDLRAGLTVDEAADRLYAQLGHDVYWLLVRRRGWSPARWRDYVTDQTAYQLLASPGRPQAAGSRGPASASRNSSAGKAPTKRS